MGMPKVPTSGFRAEDSQQAGVGGGRQRAEVLESSSSYSKDQVYQAYGGPPSKAAVGVCTAYRLSSTGCSQRCLGFPRHLGQSGCVCSAHSCASAAGRRCARQAGGLSRNALHVAAVTCSLSASRPQAQLVVQ